MRYLLIFLVFTIHCNLLTAAEPILDANERGWLEQLTKPVIAGAEMDWPPFDFVKNNNPTGYSNDLLKLAAEKVGLPLKFVSGFTWSELLEKFQSGEIDILPAVYKTPEREQGMAFTNRYITNPLVLVTHINGQKNSSLKDMAGEKLAVVEGFSINKVLAETYPEIRLFVVKNLLESLKALSLGKVDASIGSLGVISHLLKENFIPDIHIASEVVLEDPEATYLHMVTSKNQTLLRDILQKGLDAISVKKKNLLKRRWLPNELGRPDDVPDLDLSDPEEEWLLKHPKVTLGIDPSWAPFEYIDPRGQYAGISSGFVEAIEKRLKIEMSPIPDLTWSQVLAKMKAGEIDILPAVVPTQQRRTFLDFSNPYASFPVIIATHDKMPFISSIEDMASYRVGVVKDYYVEDLLRSDHPDLNLVPFEKSTEALKALNTGHIDSYVDNLVTVSEAIKQFLLNNIKIVSVTKYKMELCFGVRKDSPELIGILNKALERMDNTEKASITNAWMTPQEIKIGMDIKKILIWAIPITISLLLLLIFILIWNRHMVKEVTQRKKAEQESLENERKIKAMSQAVDDALIMIDSKSSVLFWNPAAEKMFEYSEAEAMGMNFHSIAAPERFHELAKQGLQRFAETGQGEVIGVTTQITARKRSGHEFPVEVTLSSLQMDGKWYAVGTVRDITERKKAEEEIRKTNEQYTKLIETLPNAVTQTDLEGVITYISPQALTLYGIEKESQALGTRIFQWIHPDFRENARKSINTLIQQDDHFGRLSREYQLLRQDGKAFWGAVNLAILKDEEKRPSGILVVAGDISERKEAEAMLKESQQRLELALTASNTGLWDWRPLTNEDYHNEQWYRQLGYQSSDFAEDANPLIELMHPDDEEKFMKNMALYTVKGIDDYSQEFRMKTKDGSWKWILSLGQVIERDELFRPTRLLGVHLDITERKQNEQRLSASQKRLGQIIDFLPDPTWVIDEKGQVVSWNRAVADLTGIKKDEILGMEDYEYAVPFYGERRPLLIDLAMIWDENLAKKYISIKRTEDDVLISESYHPNLKGGCYLAGTARALYSPEGVLEGAVETVRDITDQKKAEAEIKMHMEDLERFNRLVIGREEKMISLKEEVNTLLAELDRNEKYNIVE